MNGRKSIGPRTQSSGTAALTEYLVKTSHLEPPEGVY